MTETSESRTPIYRNVSSSRLVIVFGRCSCRKARQISSIVVVAMSRNDASRQKTPFITSVSIETTPPETASVPICVTICRSKIGLSSPTAHTSGSTSRSF